MSFRNLVLGIHVCVGFLLLVLTDVMLADNLRDVGTPFDMVLEQKSLAATLILMPFFIGLVYSYLRNKINYLSIIYFILVLGFTLFFNANKKEYDLIGMIMTSTIAASILVFLISFEWRYYYTKPISLSLNNENILDKLDVTPLDNLKKNIPHLLRIHVVFAINFVILATGIIVVATRKGRYISKDESSIFMSIALGIFIFAVLLWKFPKILSWFVALFYLIIFFSAEYSIFLDKMTNSYESDPLNTYFIIIFLTIFLFLAIISVSKTAREEWKMK